MNIKLKLIIIIQYKKEEFAKQFNAHIILFHIFAININFTNRVTHQNKDNNQQQETYIIYKMAKSKASKIAKAATTLLTNHTANVTTNTSSQASSLLATQANMLATIMDFVLSVFKVTDSLLMLIAYILLIYQTVYVVNFRQPKYINLRNIAVKWIMCIVIYQIKQGFVDNKDVNSYLAMLLLDIFIIFIAYPSKILKQIHLKYFSQKQNQRFQQSVTDPNKYDLTFSGRFAIGFCVFLLTICKHLIAIVMPQHRKPIQQLLRSINTVVIQKRCFWSIYTSDSKLSQPQVLQKQKIATRDFLISGTNINSSISVATSPLLPSNMKAQQQFYSITNIPSKKQIKQVIKANGEKCSNIISNGFKPIKRVSIKYTISTSELQLMDLDFSRVQSYILEQLIQKGDNVIQFIVLSPGQKISQPIYIKFKNAKELQNFMRDIQAAEKAF